MGHYHQSLIIWLGLDCFLKLRFQIRFRYRKIGDSSNSRRFQIPESVVCHCIDSSNAIPIQTDSSKELIPCNSDCRNQSKPKFGGKFKFNFLFLFSAVAMGAPGGRLRPRSMEPRSLMVNSSGRPILGLQGSSSDEDPYSVAGSGSRDARSRQTQIT